MIVLGFGFEGREDFLGFKKFTSLGIGGIRIEKTYRSVVALDSLV